MLCDRPQRLRTLCLDTERMEPPCRRSGERSGRWRQHQPDGGARSGLAELTTQSVPLLDRLACRDPLAEDCRYQFVVEHAAGTESDVGMVALGAEHRRMSIGETRTQGRARRPSASPARASTRGLRPTPVPDLAGVPGDAKGCHAGGCERRPPELADAGPVASRVVGSPRPKRYADRHAGDRSMTDRLS